MKNIYLLTMCLLFATLCFAQKNNKYDLNIESIFPYKDITEKKQEGLVSLSGEYSLNKKFTAGVKVGFSQGFQNDFANEKLAEVLVSSSLTFSEDKTLFLKPSIGIGYYDNKESGLNKPFCDISFSFCAISQQKLYVGAKLSSIILFSKNNNTEYAGFIIGYKL